jgi:ribosomal subunit interface protein
MNLQITYREMPRSEALSTHVTRLAAKLERIHGRILSCRVMVEVLHRHHLKGKRYHCRVDLLVPGAELVAGKDPPDDLHHEDMHAAIDEAFDDIDRQLREHLARMHDRRKGARSV